MKIVKKIICVIFVSLLITAGTTAFAAGNDFERIYVRPKSACRGYNNGTLEYTYNSKGYLTKHVKKDNFEGDYITTYAYDSKGNISKKVVHDGAGNSFSSKYTYDSKGNLIKAVETNSDNDTSVTTYTYNSNGDLIKKTEDSFYSFKATTYTYEKGRLTKSVTTPSGSYTKYTYNNNGTLKKKTTKYSDGQIYSYTYNTKGDIIQAKESDFYGMPSKTTYTYDNNRNLTKKKTTYSDGFYDTTTYTYSSKGRLIKTVDQYAYSGAYEDIAKYTYDDNGNLKKEIKKSSDGELIIEKIYTYDGNKNLSKEICKDNEGKTVESHIYEKTKLADYVSDKLEIRYIDKFAETGSKIEPALLIFKDISYLYKGSDYSYLFKGVDYKVSYKNNINPGKARMTVTFIGDYADVKPITLPFTITALPKINNLKTSKMTGTTVSLKWDKYGSADKYSVEQSSDGKTWKTVATVSSTSSAVKSLKKGTKYQFRIKALNKSNKPIAISKVLKTGTLTSAPTVTVKSTRSKTATVTWKKVTGASKYIVYKSTDNKNWTKVTTTTELTYTFTKLTGGKKVYVKVKAVNAYGTVSKASQVKSVTVKM